MLARLLEVPVSPQDWSEWSWAHRTSHQAIIKAVLDKKQVNLQEHPVDPINPENVQDFLINNQMMHAQFNAVLELTNFDLQSVDLEDEKQKIAWIWQHYQSHQDAETALGI